MGHRPATEFEKLAALADRGEDPSYRDWCGANGPGGECCRLPGHVDHEVYGHNNHVSYDTDHYAAWPCGYKAHVCPKCGHDNKNCDVKGAG